ncbi:MAG: hypothetical protein ACOYVD_08690 [Bacillota bacterium]
MEFKSAIETYKFIMDLETYIMESKAIPFSNKVIVDKDIVYDYLDKLRSKLPKEMKEMKKLYESYEKGEGALTCQKETNPVEAAVENNHQESCNGYEENAQKVIAEAQDFVDQLLETAQAILQDKLQEVGKGRKEINEVLSKMKIT